MNRLPKHILIILTIKKAGAFNMLIFCFMISHATPPADQTPESLIRRFEQLAEMESEEESAGFSVLVETLETLHSHPININNTNMNELRQLFMLTDIQINNLLRHIEQHGKLVAIYELQTVEGFDQHTIMTIIPFVTIDESHPRRHFSRDNLIRDGEHVFFLRYQQLLEEQLGFSEIDPEELEANPNTRYLGSPYRLYSRYRFTWYRNISLGFTAEKDPGEEFFKGTQPYGFDYYSAHLHLQDFGRLKSFSLGDFQAQFGQGLSFWSGMGFGKSTEAIGIKKNAMGLRPYTSVDENNFLRGAGATVSFGSLEITGFYSSKNRDANVLEYDSLGHAISITSLQQTGMHRTPRELEGKHAVKEVITGGHLRFNRQRISMGFTAYHMSLDALYRRRLSFYNQFEFSDNRHHGYSIDYSFLTRNLNIFGETAMDANGHIAFLNGFMISLDNRISLAAVYRYYDKKHQAPFATAFGESTRLANESGLYTGIDIRPMRGLRLYAYADHFTFPWMRFRTYTPSRGYDYLIHLEYKPNRETEIYARFRSKSKPLNTRNDAMIRYLDDVKRNQYRLNVSYPVSQSVSLRHRLEVIHHQYGSDLEKGLLVYTDLLYRNLASPLAVTIRYALFDTNGFNSRIYAYEHDVLYAFSFPFYADKGSRMYLLVKYRLHRQIDLYARFAQTLFVNRSSSGSGLDLVEGNSRTEIKAQLRIRF